MGESKTEKAPKTSWFTGLKAEFDKIIWRAYCAFQSKFRDCGSCSCFYCLGSYHCRIRCHYQIWRRYPGRFIGGIGDLWQRQTGM